MKYAPDEIIDLVADLMRKHGPDGHIDGHEIIAQKVWEAAARHLESLPQAPAPAPSPDLLEALRSLGGRLNDEADPDYKVRAWINSMPEDARAALASTPPPEAALESARETNRKLHTALRDLLEKCSAAREAGCQEDLEAAFDPLSESMDSAEDLLEEIEAGYPASPARKEADHG